MSYNANAQTIVSPGAMFSPDLLFVPPAPSSGELTIADELCDALDEFVLLRAGWDGYRAPPPAEHAIARTLEFVSKYGQRLLECDVELAPALDGGVALSVERQGRWIDITFCNDHSIRVDRSDDIDEQVGPKDLGRHVDWVFQE